VFALFDGAARARWRVRAESATKENGSHLGVRIGVHIGEVESTTNAARIAGKRGGQRESEHVRAHELLVAGRAVCTDEGVAPGRWQKTPDELEINRVVGATEVDPIDYPG
jgi:hypothetical protein